MMKRCAVASFVVALSANAAVAQLSTTRYCSDLQKVVELSGSADRFTAITGMTS
jgi:hypothetical protein